MKRILKELCEAIYSSTLFDSGKMFGSFLESPTLYFQNTGRLFLFMGASGIGIRDAGSQLFPRPTLNSGSRN